MTAISPTPPGAARPGCQEIALVTSTIDRFMLGIEMTSVDAIEEHHPEDDTPVLDILELWDLRGRDTSDAGGSRRVIALRTASGRCRLLVGSRAEVIGIPEGSLLPLPTFLEEVGRRAAVSALFISGTGFGMLLDAERVDLDRRDAGNDEGSSPS